MTTTPILSRGWCDLAECIRSTIPQDCVRLGSVTICKPCLLELSDGVEPDELDDAERRLEGARDEIEKLEEELEKVHERARQERTKETS